MRADARRNRARVLEAAEAVFAAGGVSASTEEVAHRAGVGIGTVFRHFPTKEALLEAILTERVQRLANAARALATSPDPGAALFGLITTMVEEAAGKKTYIDALADTSLESRLGRSEAGQAAVLAIGVLLARAQEAGTVRDDIGVRELIALVVGMSRAAEHAGHDRMLRVMFDGLRRSPGSHR